MSTWTIDPTHSQVGFAVRHMMISTVRGQFRDIDAAIEIDEASPERSTVQARLAAASVETGSPQRDDHLRSADFFDAATYPEILFTSTSIERAGDGYRIHADLTIRDQTRPVVLDAEFHGFAAGMDGVRRAALSARTKISRKDWGLSWNVALESGGWLVSDEIRIELEIAAVEVASTTEVNAAA
jgi:polyisoprenoid-binding protein YceI